MGNLVAPQRFLGKFRKSYGGDIFPDVVVKLPTTIVNAAGAGSNSHTFSLASSDFRAGDWCYLIFTYDFNTSTINTLAGWTAVSSANGVNNTTGYNQTFCKKLVASDLVGNITFTSTSGKVVEVTGVGYTPPAPSGYDTITITGTSNSSTSTVPLSIQQSNVQGTVISSISTSTSGILGTPSHDNGIAPFAEGEVPIKTLISNQPLQQARVLHVYVCRSTTTNSSLNIPATAAVGYGISAARVVHPIGLTTASSSVAGWRELDTSVPFNVLAAEIAVNMEGSTTSAWNTVVEIGYGPVGNVQKVCHYVWDNPGVITSGLVPHGKPPALIHCFIPKNSRVMYRTTTSLAGITSIYPIISLVGA